MGATNTLADAREPSVDSIQEAIATYAAALEFGSLPAETVHAAKKRIIDALGGLYPALSAEPAIAARNLAARMYPSPMATVLGGDQKSTVDMAAFVNATTGRYAEMNDTLHIPGQPGGHPSDVITPLLAVGEYLGSSGKDLLVAIVLAYEVYIGMADATNLPNWDASNWACLATAVGAGKLLGFDVAEFRNCVSLAVIPNNALRRARRGSLTMWKAAAAGQAGRSGVFAALLVREGMEGPTLPFEGKTGWLDGVGGGVATTLGPMGGSDVPFKLHRTIFKPRGMCGTAIASALAAEKAHQPGLDPSTIKSVLVQTYRDAKAKLGTQPHHWHPTTRESADHSIPYVVSAVLVDGAATFEMFDDAHLADPTIRSVLKTVEVVADDGFTRDYDTPPYLHRTRVTVTTMDGAAVTGETGGEHGEIGAEMSDEDVVTKFRSLTRRHLSAEAAERLLATVTDLDGVADVAVIPPLMRVTATPG